MKKYTELRNDNIFDIKQDELSTYTASLSVADILRYINDNKPNNGAILKIPNFQRDSSIKNNKSVWNKRTKLIFIDSLLRGLPSPSILIWEKINGNKKDFFLLDGSQRISAINDFVNGEKINGKLKKVKLKNNYFKDSDFYNKSYHELKDEIKENFDNYRIDTIFIRYTGKEEERETAIISEIFARLNSGSFNLNRSEIRHAIFYNKKDFVFELIYKYLDDPNSYIKKFLINIKKYSQNKRSISETFLLRLLAYGYYISKNQIERYNFNSSLDCIINNYICILKNEEEFKIYLKNLNEFFKYIYEHKIDSLYACKQEQSTQMKEDNLLINNTAVLETFVEGIFSYILSKINNDKTIKQILDGIDWGNIKVIRNKIWNSGYFQNKNKQSNFSDEASFFFTTTSNKCVWKRFDYLKNSIENEWRNK